ncbi:DUF2637 domain-containing protein [Streptomyces sp. RB6PN25]|uniref:DUF2637 domain-containing protein n=1 Tax=Streptomyces humicola TaxID=2953240 RepID=A0ABT1PZM5_9ACTN|nr:DUF2637 domain-containing protein [Streptomyces humicola]MCQ4083118.1 DUF2637 domain-containing protein [Streptomyces humicola]
MRMSDISPDWMLSAVVGLVVAGTAATMFLRSRKTRAAQAEQLDSWERSEDRRRKKEAVYGSASYILLFCCAAVAAALSFHGLVGFGEQNLGLSGGWEYLVPFGLDGAAMFCSVLAVREASHGDAALGSRLLVWTFAAASAWFNWVHAPRGYGHAGAPEFFAGMSLSAAVLFDRALKQTRRAALREQGLVPRPLPQIRVMRWVRAPIETYRAWSLMLLENVRTLDEAVEEVRDDRREREQERTRRRDRDRLQRARIKAIARQHRGWGRTRGGRQVELTAGTPAAEPAPAPASAQTAEAAELPVRARPALQSIPGESVTIDLTAEDDTMTLPRLDSLEAKLKDLERQFG